MDAHMHPRLQVAKELFDEEVAGHKAELELLTNTMERHQSMPKQASTRMTSFTPPTTDDSLNTRPSTHSKSVIDSPESLHEITRTVSEKSETVTDTAADQERRMSAEPKTSTAMATERRMSTEPKTTTATATERRVSLFHQTLHHNQDHLFAKLADKDHQLKSAKQELTETKDLMQDMENELERLRRENAELVKLQGTLH
jgi:hypothetical protein